MKLTPIYSCRNCKKTYPGTQQEIANVPLDKLVSRQQQNVVRNRITLFRVVQPLRIDATLVPAARFTLGSQDHVFRIGGKVIQMSDLHQCNDHEVGLANFVKLQVGEPTVQPTVQPTTQQSIQSTDSRHNTRTRYGDAKGNKQVRG